MPDRKKHLQDLAAFIRDNRSNESHFEKLYATLHEEWQRVSESGDGGKDYQEGLEMALENYGAVYKSNKEKGISTWSEFENFVSQFEKTITDALNVP